MRRQLCSMVLAAASSAIAACAPSPLARYEVASELPVSEVIAGCQKVGAPRSFDVRHTGRLEATLDYLQCKPEEEKEQRLTIYTRFDEDIRLAVIRTIIGFIREEKPDHFEWSGRAGKTVVLSSRTDERVPFVVSADLTLRGQWSWRADVRDR